MSILQKRMKAIAAKQTHAKTTVLAITKALKAHDPEGMHKKGNFADMYRTVYGSRNKDIHEVAKKHLEKHGYVLHHKDTSYKSPEYVYHNSLANLGHGHVIHHYIHKPVRHPKTGEIWHSGGFRVDT